MAAKIVLVVLVVLVVGLAVAIFTEDRANAAALVDVGGVAFTIGQRGSHAGFLGGAGGYGGRLAGTFPAALFVDAEARTVSAFYERDTTPPSWKLVFDIAHPANAWADDAALADIVITIEYSDQRDLRSFPMGRFVVERGERFLDLEPPVNPRGDLRDRVGTSMRVSFSTFPPPATAVAAPIEEAVADSGSFIEFLQLSTPRGGVTAQLLVTIVIFGGFMFKALPSQAQTPYRGQRAPSVATVLMGAIVLALTPWVPALFGFGDAMARVIVSLNLVCGAFAYKALASESV